MSWLRVMKIYYIKKIREYFFLIIKILVKLNNSSLFIYEFWAIYTLISIPKKIISSTCSLLLIHSNKYNFFHVFLIRPSAQEIYFSWEFLLISDYCWILFTWNECRRQKWISLLMDLSTYSCNIFNFT